MFTFYAYLTLKPPLNSKASPKGCFFVGGNTNANMQRKNHWKFR